MFATPKLRTRVYFGLCIPSPAYRVACMRSHYPQVARHRPVPWVRLRPELDHVDVVRMYRDRLAVCSAWHHSRRSGNDLTGVSR